MKKRFRIDATSLLLALLAVLFFAAGLFLLLYPSAADYINTSMSRGTISSYREKVSGMSTVDYDALLSSARDFNERLFRESPYIGELSAEGKKTYNSLLNLSGSGVIGYCEVPKIGVYLPIYHGTTNEILQNAVGHLEGSSLPVDGESVHCVLSGHSGLPSAKLFTDLDQLAIGDRFFIHVLGETFTYEVFHIAKVLPEALDSMTIERGQDLCTLLTCTPYGVNSHRLVVTGRRVPTPAADSDSAGEPVPEGPPGWDATQLVAPLSILAGIFLLAGFSIGFLGVGSSSGKGTPKGSSSSRDSSGEGDSTSGDSLGKDYSHSDDSSGKGNSPKGDSPGKGDSPKGDS